MNKTMIPRTLIHLLQNLFSKYPILTVIGPRQSGKTTLLKSQFPELPYANLEHPKTRELAENDPISFLKQMPNGGILDEIQRTPHLLSYIQTIVD